MQTPAGSKAQPEKILEWLQKEMGYRPLGPYASSTKASMPTVDSLRKICRGNMIPVWNFLLKRVKSEKTVENIRRNILVHGADDNGADVQRNRGRKKEKLGVGKEGLGESSSRKMALQERELAEKEVERLRQVVKRQHKELKVRMLEVSQEEAERKRMLDERSNYRHKQVMLEAYDQQRDEAVKIFAEYHKRLRVYVNQARNAQRSSADSSVEMVTSFLVNHEKEAVYSKGAKSSDVILIETARERNIRKVCESLAMLMAEKIQNSFPAYEGSGIHMNPQLEAAKLGIDLDGDLPVEIKNVIVDCLKSPLHLLQAITSYTERLKTAITKEIEKIDIRADAEALRTTNYCLNLAAEHDKIVTEKWLPEIKNAVLNAQKCLEDCKYVRGLLDEWWEQPASTVVDWLSVDGENVAAWQNHVKQLLSFYDK
ncbi:hypothetical protein Adt_20557 [Abeliophyllum distichum]|uniref:AUGMIN subunit 5 n=1 Tax=Abeliophyllum distichum TaxID=126358 RepID=A0ABD1SWW5_9LAMI